MLRLLATRGLCDLWMCGHLVPSFVVKRKAVSLLPVSSACHHGRLLFGRTFTAGSPLWKDALQPQTDPSGEVDPVDLDKWKSVMRSNAALTQKTSKDEEASGGEKVEPDEDLKSSSSSLEATREMVSMWREAGKHVPQEMTDEQVRAVAELTTRSARKKYLKFLAVKEGLKRSEKVKKQQRKAERENLNQQQRAQDGDGAEEDDQGRQRLSRTFIHNFWDRSLEYLLGWRSAQAMMFDQPLVLDMSYDSHMSRREVKNTVSQLMEMEGMNRRATDPYHLHYCNLQEDGVYKQELIQRYGAETWERLLITSTNKHYMDLFPREQLVYLTADSPNVLHKFDHSKVYIIGALVDRSIQSGLSLANAKRLKLATARLPLDEFLHWEIGAKNLTLDQMIRIMLTIKETGKWEEALKFVPQRKHDGFHQEKKRTQKDSNRVRGVTNQGQRLDAGTQFRPRQVTPKSEGPGLQRSGFNKAAGPKVWTPVKGNMEGGKRGSKKMWWEKDQK